MKCFNFVYDVNHKTNSLNTVYKIYIKNVTKRKVWSYFLKAFKFLLLQDSLS